MFVVYLMFNSLARGCTAYHTSFNPARKLLKF